MLLQSVQTPLLEWHLSPSRVKYSTVRDRPSRKQRNAIANSRMNDPERTGDYQPGRNDEPAVDERSRAQPQHIGRYRDRESPGPRRLRPRLSRPRRPVAAARRHQGAARKLVDRPEAAEAYLTEARTVANLDHPHIVPVFDVGSTEDCPCYVVSKYIDGTDLATQAQAVPAVDPRSRRTGGDGGRGVAPRPQARAGASGHQAGQHPARQERQAVRGGFRAGLARAGRGQGAALRRDARLHESRTGPWRRASGRWPQRHLQPGRGLLRAAGGTPAVPGRHRRRN